MITRRLCLAAAAGLPLSMAATRAAAQPAAVRIGYIPTTTVQAQIAHTLDRTDILQRNGLQGRLTLFNSSPAVNEALVSGAVDVGFVSDFAAITVMAAGAPVTAIGHQSSFRGALMATPASGIRRLEDLRGRSVHGLFGVTVYQSAQEMVRRVGLQPGRDMQFVNMNFTEMADAIRARRIEAFFTWDPWISFFEKQGLAATLAADIAPTMVIMARDAYLREQAEAAARLLRAHVEALFYAVRHKERSNAWFRIPEAARQIDLDVVEAASAFDPQWQVRSFQELRVGFTPAQVQRLQALAQFCFDNKLTPRLAPVGERVNLALGQRVQAELAARPFEVDSVRVTAQS
jgi:sulfonate transport system substrate-binding protein